MPLAVGELPLPPPAPLAPLPPATPLLPLRAMGALRLKSLFESRTNGRDPTTCTLAPAATLTPEKSKTATAGPPACVCTTAPENVAAPETVRASVSNVTVPDGTLSVPSEG